MSFSSAPLKTGVATFQPGSWPRSQVDLQHLADVHTGGHAQGVQHDVQGGAVGQEGHILLGQDAGHDALVAVAAGHLVAHGDLALLGDVDAHHHVDAGGQLVAGLAGEDLHVHDDTALAVRHLQGGVTDLAGLLTEDGAQQALLGGEVGLALGGDLTNQNIAGVDLGTTRMMPRSSRSFRRPRPRWGCHG